MYSPVVTTTALLEGLRDHEDAPAWDALEQRIRPVVHALAKRRGLDDHAAADVAQETLITFLRLYSAGRYRRASGSLRGWILGIAKKKILEARRSARKLPVAVEAEDIDSLADDDPLVAIWNEESRRAVLRAATEQLALDPGINPETLHAFRRVGVEGRSASEVAEELGMSENAVYLAKRRCLEKLRASVQAMELAWEMVC